MKIYVEKIWQKILEFENKTKQIIKESKLAINKPVDKLNNKK